MDLFLIDVPPPTISGQLHMGHVFSYCHMDFVARHQKLLGKELIYPFCFDSNGLPTEKLAQGAGHSTTPNIIKFAEETSQKYSGLFQKIGMGYSQHAYHTYDATAIQLAQLSFADLCQKNLAYKAEADYFYCPVTGVSVSQSEIDDNGCYERSGAKVLTKRGVGWFIKMRDERLLDRIRQAIDAISWKPVSFKHRLHRWLDDIRFDWSISRERNYGIPIPGESGLVFDTWFTSSLSPQLAWASHTKQASLQCPIFDVRFQAHDIIRTWALFTIIKSLYHNDQIPWKTIVISGHALDKDGRKISKTLGNFVPPDEYLNKYGKNGVRYWTAHNQHGTDTRTDIQLMEKGGKLINKIKNARRFVLMRAGDQNNVGKDEVLELEWSAVQANFHDLMTQYQWSTALDTLVQFFWHRYCDYWIEHGKKNAISTSLSTVLDQMLQCFTVFFPTLVADIST